MAFNMDTINKLLARELTIGVGYCIKGEPVRLSNFAIGVLVSQSGSVYNLRGKRLGEIEIGGYSRVNCYERVSGRRTTMAVHRLVADAWIENPDGKPFVNHMDRNKKNNSLANLEWVTASENMKHAKRTSVPAGTGFPKTFPISFF